jgi:hypothetical protein
MPTLPTPQLGPGVLSTEGEKQLDPSVGWKVNSGAELVVALRKHQLFDLYRKSRLLDF